MLIGKQLRLSHVLKCGPSQKSQPQSPAIKFTGDTLPAELNLLTLSTPFWLTACQAAAHKQKYWTLAKVTEKTGSFSLLLEHMLFLPLKVLLEAGFQYLYLYQNNSLLHLSPFAVDEACICVRTHECLHMSAWVIIILLHTPDLPVSLKLESLMGKLLITAWEITLKWKRLYTCIFDYHICCLFVRKHFPSGFEFCFMVFLFSDSGPTVDYCSWGKATIMSAKTKDDSQTKAGYYKQADSSLAKPVRP